jgi:hypothetical protein
MQANQAETQAIEQTAIVAILTGLMAGQAKLEAAQAAAAEISDAAKDSWKAAGQYYANRYGSLDAMLSETGQGEVKADIIAALPADIKAARAKREAGQLLTTKQIAESKMPELKRREALRELDKANAYMGYQTIYFKRLCEYAFPSVKTDLAKYVESIETAFKRLEKISKAIPAGLTPDDISMMKAALQKVGTKVGAKTDAKATAK